MLRAIARVSLVATVILLLAGTPSDAGGRGRGGHAGRHGHEHGRHHVIFGGAWFWGPPYPYWWYYTAPYYAYPPTVVVEQPPEYIEQPQPAAPAPEAFWYYCQPTGAYYPTVPTCAEPWIKVPPRAQ